MGVTEVHLTQPLTPLEPTPQLYLGYFKQELMIFATIFIICTSLMTL